MPQEFNVIEAKFTSRDKKCVIGPLWQYDYGQILKITGIELPDIYEVHFSNDPRGVAKQIIGSTDGVRIPSEYLTSGSNVFAWFYVHQGDDDGTTLYQIEIQVRRRAKPCDIALNPEEISVVAELIGSMNAVLEATREERSKAEEAKLAAEKAKEEAIKASESTNGGYDDVESAVNAAIMEIVIPYIEEAINKVLETRISDDADVVQTLNEVFERELATDEEVGDIIDGVFGEESGDETTPDNGATGDDDTGGESSGEESGDEIATDEEVKDLVTDIFG